MIQLQCRTTFDITATGVRSHFQPSRLPFVSNNNQLISTQAQWQHARNQQRNWETVNQIIALRCLPEHITAPVAQDQHWQFKFDIPDISAVSTAHNHTGLLEQDADDVPMIVGLGEAVSAINVLKPGVNIWFEVVK
jgi:hypothetical protein